MSRYLLRRLLISIPVLAGISLVLFTILALAPGDPLGEAATNANVPPEIQARIREQFGLNDPIPVRYARWFTSMAKGDWGYSFVSRVDVGTLILQRLPTTLFVLGAAQLLGLLVALPIGIYSAMRPYSVFDQIATTFAFIGFSLPTFFTGILFILFFSIYLDWLPFIYRADISASGWHWYWEHVRQAIMPVAVLGLFQGAYMTRFVRSSVLEVSRLDYINTARAKGLSEKATIIKHVVRNALIPVVTLVALQIPAIFTGAVITEQIFRVPGIGSLLITSILANDTPVIMAITFVFSGLVVLFNLLADLLYGWLDPRISYRETIRKKARANGRHKRQSGGHGQFGDVWLEIEPLPMGGEETFIFDDKIVGGVVPNQFIPGVEKGVRESLKRGFISGNPLVYVKVALVDGKYHPVDSSAQSFEIAASYGMQEAVPLANPTILEPVMTVTITVPEANMGDIMSDINTKRGRVLGMSNIGNGMQQITANVPQAEMLHYATDLRSITQGRGSFKMEFYQYEEVPTNVQQEIIARYKKAEAEK